MNPKIFSYKTFHKKNLSILINQCQLFNVIKVIIVRKYYAIVNQNVHICSQVYITDRPTVSNPEKFILRASRQMFQKMAFGSGDQMLPMLAKPNGSWPLNTPPKVIWRSK